MTRFFLGLMLLIFFGGCNQNNKSENQKKLTIVKDSSLKKNYPAYDVEPIPGTSIIKLDERLNNADSMVFTFYNDPHGKDSLRYTRYYKEISITDTSILNNVKAQLNDTTVRFERMKKCHSEGKIFCFTDGNVFQTIYFSSHNNDCSFVYIIRNGEFFYSKISPIMIAQLADLKPKAK